MKIENKISERKQWFIDRIGKIVYRNKTTCKCGICESAYIFGLIIDDECHADYLYNCECEFTIEGYPLKYFDTISERDEFEKNIQDK